MSEIYWMETFLDCKTWQDLNWTEDLSVTSMKIYVDDCDKQRVLYSWGGRGWKYGWNFNLWVFNPFPKPQSVEKLPCHHNLENIIVTGVVLVINGHKPDYTYSHSQGTPWSKLLTTFCVWESKVVSIYCSEGLPAPTGCTFSGGGRPGDGLVWWSLEQPVSSWLCLR